MVCRQWRVASAHEDFWKSLDFGNRQVSPVQGTISTNLEIFLSATCIEFHVSL